MALVFQNQIAYNSYTVIICHTFMRKNEYIGCLFIFMLLSAGVLAGCGRQEGTFYAATQNADAENAGSFSGDSLPRNDANVINTANETVGNEAGKEADEASTKSPSFCYVHICGAVLNPGVYEVPEGSRLYEVILLAGGLRADACDYLVNQAQAVNDGMQVYIPTVQEAQGEIAEQDISARDFRTEEGTDDRDTRIDLNSATKEQLTTLPGIGETRAQAIIAYREAHGGFQKIEELMEVNGIKQGVYDRLKEMIKV